MTADRTSSVRKRKQKMPVRIERADDQPENVGGGYAGSCLRPDVSDFHPLLVGPRRFGDRADRGSPQNACCKLILTQG